MSLLEIVVSTGLIALLLVGVFTILPGTLLAVQRAQAQYTATQLAQTIIEQQRATPASQMVPVSNQGVQPAPVVDNITFTPYLTIRPVPDSTAPPMGTPPLMMVSVTVEWQCNGQTLTTGAQLELTDMTPP